MDGFLGELLGTFILIVLGAGVCCGVNLNKTYGKNNSTWLLINLGWGMGVTMGVYVAGHLGSLGHLNPAVTLGSAIFGLFPWSQVVPYLLGQFIGAFLGAAVVIIQYYPHFKVTKPEEGNTVGNFATIPAINNPVFNFLSEVIATFAFMYILLNLGNFTTGMKPFIVGFLIVSIGMSLGETTGYAINPARDWGPRLAYTLFPVPNKGTTNWNYAWVPMVGPIVGAVIATGLFKIL
ncbi:MIP/aquaporin family protein [Furfurilactobacillus rossiae]|uniref:Glycerol uptake facilitator n=1 Tax=Furfurilactobacillus rossiae DSM 15814 TaxID=1114972 RepID=A0A0R1RS28_9LACO|nr:MIP/aquaporin family protein [Furfurilactobacillus rossiae]KRL56123.1 glycerol uptake facilitator [Furfurilactobacillus rossiae DSM 15814]QFR66149.1 MIP family channel protein [Furfurilactobacillus rossiae]QLE61579.1 Glycerol uptake facilitator protein [Furfurilactobacillus rossiae]